MVSPGEGGNVIFAAPFLICGAFAVRRIWTGRARTATGSKLTQPGMRTKTLDSSLCRQKNFLGPLFDLAW